MSRHARENPEEPPNHDWFAGQKRTDPNLCLRCGERPKLPPLVWGGKVVARPNLCRECEAQEVENARKKLNKTWANK